MHQQFANQTLVYETHYVRCRLHVHRNENPCIVGPWQKFLPQWLSFYERPHPVLD